MWWAIIWWVLLVGALTAGLSWLWSTDRAVTKLEIAHNNLAREFREHVAAIRGDTPFNPTETQVIGRAARSAAKDWLQELMAVDGQPFSPELARLYLTRLTEGRTNENHDPQ